MTDDQYIYDSIWEEYRQIKPDDNSDLDIDLLIKLAYERGHEYGYDEGFKIAYG